MENIAENLRQVRQNIAESAIKAGRSPDDVKLIAVTKTVSIERIEAAIHAGVTAIGENRVQEFLPKYEALAEKYPHVEWHFIGHLQRNKVKFIIDKVDMIHSVHSVALAEEINKYSKKQNCNTNVLLEMSLVHEANKVGFSMDGIVTNVKNIFLLSNVRFKGFMCVPPFVRDAELQRKNFEKLRDLRLDIMNGMSYHTSPQTTDFAQYFSDKDDFELSMGMSGDYQIAVETGATMVRIGSDLFGRR